MPPRFSRRDRQRPPQQHSFNDLSGFHVCVCAALSSSSDQARTSSTLHLLRRFLFHLLIGIHRIHESSGIRKTATFVDRGAHTHARLISHGDATTPKFVGIQRESVRFRDRAKCPRHTLLKNDSIFVFCFLFLFVSSPFFFQSKRDLIRWLYINRPAAILANGGCDWTAFDNPVSAHINILGPRLLPG